MCPPASFGPPVELNDYPTEEIICKLLVQLKSGCSLPPNVLSDVDPYQHKPSNLPEEIWYFCSGTKKDTENGFWRATGEACEIYSTSAIIGLRKTLQYYEGQSPHGQRTNWRMQEYTITEKYGSKLDTRGLYRVFLVADSSNGRPPRSELLEKNADNGARASTMADQPQDPSSPVADRSLDPLLEDYVSTGDYLSIDDLAVPSSHPPSAMANQSQDPPSPRANRSPDSLLEDYVSRGDYLSFNDLAIPLSQTTSSANTSCRSMLSDDFFDSDALMRELGDDPVDQEIQDSRINLNLCVMNPTTIVSTGSLNGGSESNPTPQNKSENQKEESTPNSVDNTTASSSSSEGSSKEEKRNRAKKRKMMKFLCFFLF